MNILVVVVEVVVVMGLGVRAWRVTYLSTAR
jgi:hypothetical protein